MVFPQARAPGTHDVKKRCVPDLGPSEPIFLSGQGGDNGHVGRPCEVRTPYSDRLRLRESEAVGVRGTISYSPSVGGEAKRSDVPHINPTGKSPCGQLMCL